MITSILLIALGAFISLGGLTCAYASEYGYEFEGDEPMMPQVILVMNALGAFLVASGAKVAFLGSRLPIDYSATVTTVGVFAAVTLAVRVANRKSWSYVPLMMVFVISFLLLCLAQYALSGA